MLAQVEQYALVGIQDCVLQTKTRQYVNWIALATSHADIIYNWHYVKQNTWL